MSTKDRLIASAQKNLEKGQIQKAIKDYQELLKLEPKVDQHRQKLADLLCRANQQGEALEHYDALAKGYAERGFYSKAIAVYKQVQKVDPARTEVYERLAELNRNLGLTGNAMAEYRTLLDFHEKRNMAAEAAGVLQKMVEIEPDNVNLQVRLLQYLLKEKLFDKVRDSLITTCESCYKSGDAGKVQKLFDSILPKLPAEREFHLEIVKKLHEKGFIPAEILVFNALLKNEPDDPFLLEGVSNAHKDAGDTTKEALVLGHLLHLEPTPVRCERLVRIWLEIGEFQKALRELEQYEEIFDQNGEKSVLVELYHSLQAKLPGDLKVRSALVRLVGGGLPPEVHGDVAASALPGDLDSTLHEEVGSVLAKETPRPFEPVANSPASPAVSPVSLVTQPVEHSEFQKLDQGSSFLPEAEISLDFLEGLAVQESPVPEISVPVMELVQETDLAPLVDIDFDLTDISVEDTQVQVGAEVSDDFVAVELNFSDLPSENDPEQLSVRDKEKETEFNLSALTLENNDDLVVVNEIEQKSDPDLPILTLENDIDLLAEINVMSGSEFDFSELTPENEEELQVESESEPACNLDFNDEFDLSTAADEIVETSDALQLGKEVELSKPIDSVDSLQIPGADQCHLVNLDISSFEDLSLDIDIIEDDDLSEIIDDEDVIELEPLDEDDLVSELEELEELLEQEMLAESTPDVALEIQDAIDNDIEKNFLDFLPDTTSENEQYEDIVDAEFIGLDVQILNSSEFDKFNKLDNDKSTVASVEIDQKSLVVDENKHQHAIEEIDFYICQGLFEPAEKLCRTILAEDPSHSLAAIRLKEVLQEKSKIESETDDSFFDLASELLDDGALQATEGLANVGDIDRFRFDSVFSEFKKGVESQIDQEDSEAHYDLGIAYKEMGLVDDAIEEFKKAMRNPKRFADSLILIGICNAEKGAFLDAVAIFESAISHPDVNDSDKIGMKYELGLVYEVWGKPQDALVCFESVANVDHFFRSVGEKIDALRRSLSVNNSDQVVESPDSASPGKSRISFV